MADLAVLIKTFHREAAFLNCIGSIRDRLEPGAYRIYVADDGPVTAGKRAEYERLRAEGHVVLELDHAVGASVARNRLLERLGEERYVLRLDDDFELTPETDVNAMRAILDGDPRIGVVAGLERQVGRGKGTFSGRISDGQGILRREDGALIKELKPLRSFAYRTVGGVRCAECGFSRNLLLIRREVFETVRWEEDLPFAGEHADFLLQLHRAGWLLVFTPESIHAHREDLGAGAGVEYEELKRRQEQMWRVYRAKWGVDRIKVRYPVSGWLRRAALRLLP